MSVENSRVDFDAPLEISERRIPLLEFDEQRLFSGSEDSTIKVWDLNTNSCSATLTFNDPISHIKYDGQRLFLSSKDHTTTVLDFAASDEDIFKEIAGLLTSKSDEIATEAMNRFSRMPPRAKNAIYGELEKPLDPNNVTNIGKRALAQAILNYLAKQG